jgi:hypothetical protein
MEENKKKEPSKTLSLGFKAIAAAYNFIPSASRKVLDSSFEQIGMTFKGLLLSVQNTFETGDIKLFPIQAILNVVFLSLPAEGKQYIENFVKSRFQSSVPRFTKLLNDFAKGQNSKDDTDAFIWNMGIMADEAVVYFLKISYLELGALPYIHLMPTLKPVVLRDGDEPRHSLVVHIINPLTNTMAYEPMFLNDFSLFVRDKIMQYNAEGLDVDAEIARMQATKRLN